MAEAIPPTPALAPSFVDVMQAGQATEGPAHHVNADIAVMMADVAEDKKKQAAE